jgi:hypothetical protein
MYNARPIKTSPLIWAQTDASRCLVSAGSAEPSWRQHGFEIKKIKIVAMGAALYSY